MELAKLDFIDFQSKKNKNSQVLKMTGRLSELDGIMNESKYRKDLERYLLHSAHTLGLG